MACCTPQGSANPDAPTFDPKISEMFTHKGYSVEKKLGAGAYGTVYKAVHVQSGMVCAVKVMDLTLMNDMFRAKFLPRELQALISCKHENLVQTWDIFRADNKIFIFMEFAGNGDLSGYVKKNSVTKDPLMATWFLQVSNGLNFLHSRLQITHRDIKLDNMLLNDSFVAKLTDFGFAKVCVNQLHKLIVMCRTFCGTAPYKSPQILARKPYNAFRSDVWSMGISLYIMLHRRFPFHFRDRQMMLNEINDYPAFIQSRYRENLPEEATKLMDAMLHPNERKRTNMKAVCANEWLNTTAAQKSVS